MPAARITGLFICGFSVWNSSSGMSASLRGERDVDVALDRHGQEVRVVLERRQLERRSLRVATTMFFTACSLGT